MSKLTLPVMAELGMQTPALSIRSRQEFRVLLTMLHYHARDRQWEGKGTRRSVS